MPAWFYVLILQPIARYLCRLDETNECDTLEI
jgi:hypothetical protein